MEVIVENNGILWSNKKNIEEGLGHMNLPVITRKCNSDCRKHRYQLVDNPKTQPNKIFLHKDLELKVTMDCRTVDPCKFKRKLGLNILEVISSKQQTLLGTIKDSFEGENTQTGYNVLGYKDDLYFHDYKLAIEVDKFGHSDRNIDCEIQRQKTTKKEFGCEFIRINPDEDFNIFKLIKSYKKSFVDKISKRLSQLEFKSDHSI